MRNFILAALLLASAPVFAQDTTGLAPWEKDATDSVLPRNTPASPRALLKIFGFTESDFAAFDGLKEPTPAARPTVEQLLFEIPKMKREDISQWARSNTSLKEIAASNDNRFQFFKLKGVATKLKVVALNGEAAERLGFKEYVQLTVNIPQQGEAIVITRNAPKAWRTGDDSKAINQPVEFTGLYIIGESADAPLYFVASEARWLPTKPNEKMGVSADHVLLASLGVDIGAFDRMSMLKLGKNDREPFYEMLAAMDSTSNDQLQSNAADYQLTDLLKNPDQQHGRLLYLSGEARKVTKVLVEEEDVRKRFGIDHYWQIDMFIPLPAGQKIRLDPGENAPVYSREFPATLCVREIPELWKQELGDSAKSGALITEKIVAPVFFFKLWAYRSEFVEQHERTHQVAPMLIGRVPKIVREESRAGEWIAIGGGFVFFLVIAGFWFAYWRYAKADKKFEEETLNRQFDLEEGQSLNEMGLEASDGPDFSHLDQ